MMFWKVLIVLLLVSFCQAEEIDVSTACLKLYDSLNILFEHYPNDFGIEFPGGKTPYLNYPNGKAYVNLPIRIGQEGCHARVTENNGSKEVIVTLSGIVTAKLQFPNRWFIVEDAHISVTIQAEVDTEYVQFSPTSVNVVRINKVYTDGGGQIDDVTDKWAGQISSTFAYEASKYITSSLMSTGGPIPLKDLKWLEMLSLNFFSEAFEFWTHQEIGFLTGLIN